MKKPTKKQMKKDIDTIYDDCIDHFGLPIEFRIGMTHFKKQIVNYVNSLYPKTKNR